LNHFRYNFLRISLNDSSLTIIARVDFYKKQRCNFECFSWSPETMQLLVALLSERFADDCLKNMFSKILYSIQVCSTDQMTANNCYNLLLEQDNLKTELQSLRVCTARLLIKM